MSKDSFLTLPAPEHSHYLEEHIKGIPSCPFSLWCQQPRESECQLATTETLSQPIPKTQTNGLYSYKQLQTDYTNQVKCLYLSLNVFHTHSYVQPTLTPGPHNFPLSDAEQPEAKGLFSQALFSYMGALRTVGPDF